MEKLKFLFDNNKAWAHARLAEDPNFFTDLSHKQQPKYLWIGCSDSRIPANQVIGLGPGEVFVHRNIANLFPHTDFNCLSVLEYGVNCLGIEHVIVCGHYGCGGVIAAMEEQQHGLVDNWLRHIRDVYSASKKELDLIEDKALRHKKLVELNVVQQVMNVCHTTIVQNAWERSQPLCVHGWVYDLDTGLIHDLSCCISSFAQINETYITSVFS